VHFCWPFSNVYDAVFVFVFVAEFQVSCTGPSYSKVYIILSNVGGLVGEHIVRKQTFK